MQTADLELLISPHLICLVVVLRVELEHFRLLGVVEGADELIEVEFLAPLLALDEPGLY